MNNDWRSLTVNSAINNLFKWMKSEPGENVKNIDKMDNKETKEFLPDRISSLKDNNLRMKDDQSLENIDGINNYNLTIGTISLIIEEPKEKTKPIVKEKKNSPGKTSANFNRYYLRV